MQACLKMLAHGLVMLATCGLLHGAPRSKVKIFGSAETLTAEIGQGTGDLT